MFKLQRRESEITEVIEHYKKHYPKKIKYYHCKYPFTKKQDNWEQVKTLTNADIENYYQKRKTLAKKNNSITQRISTLPTANDNLERSIRRSKESIRDIILCNEFTHFCTFTFGKQHYDIPRCVKSMQNWLKNQSRLDKNFQYLIVPEYHKDKLGIHFHALTKNYSGKKLPTGKYTKGRQIYNIAGFRSGFSTYVRLDKDTERVAHYVTKYITKDMPTLNGRTRYWCSKGLLRPYYDYDQGLDLLDYIDTYDIDDSYDTDLYKINVLRPKPYFFPD